MSVTLTNRSPWPDWFLTSIGNWLVVNWPIADRIDQNLDILFVEVEHYDAWSVGDRQVKVSLKRRCFKAERFPYIHKPDYCWSRSYPLHSNVEVLVFAMALSMAYQTEANRAVFEPNPGSQRRKVEDGRNHANQTAYAMLELYRVDRFAIIRRLLTLEYKRLARLARNEAYSNWKARRPSSRVKYAKDCLYQVRKRRDAARIHYRAQIYEWRMRLWDLKNTENRHKRRMAAKK